jgi:hypothetical protein
MVDFPGMVDFRRYLAGSAGGAMEREEESMKKGYEIKGGWRRRVIDSKLQRGGGRYTPSLSRRLVIFGFLFLFISVGIFSAPPIGAKGAFASEGYGDGASHYPVSGVLPGGCSAVDIYRLLFDFTIKYINGEMEPETVLRTFFEIISALEDGVLTEGEILVIINNIYSVDTIYL